METKALIKELIIKSLEQLKAEAVISDFDESKIIVERTRDKTHGDFATTIALTLAKSANIPSRDLVAQILDHLPASPSIQKAELAGPGFINFFVEDSALYQVLKEILEKKDHYGCSELGAKKKILLEF